jgi:tripartite-type tricarboxylate transporter receptor subunit TctC
MKVHRIFVIMALCIVLAAPISATAGTWKPAKPIKLIVPWGAGGSTDQVTRGVPVNSKPLWARRLWL